MLKYDKLLVGVVLAVLAVLANILLVVGLIIGAIMVIDVVLYDPKWFG